jgi:hypothetical protein
MSKRPSPLSSQVGVVKKIKIKSTGSDRKNKIDSLLAKFVFGCNFPIQSVEDPNFRNLIHELDPDYKIPCGKTLKGKLLNNLVEEQKKSRVRDVKTFGTLMLDGWRNPSSNTKEEAFLVRPRDDGDDFFLVSANFTTLKENTENLVEAIKDAIEIAEKEYGIIIDSIITDNAFNMRAAANRINAISYGCKAHVANLALIDVTDLVLKEDVRSVVICYRKPGLAKRVIDLGGTALCYASAVRLLEIQI